MVRLVMQLAAKFRLSILLFIYYCGLMDSLHRHVLYCVFLYYYFLPPLTGRARGHSVRPGGYDARQRQRQALQRILRPYHQGTSLLDYMHKSCLWVREKLQV